MHVSQFAVCRMAFIAVVAIVTLLITDWIISATGEAARCGNRSAAAVVDSV